MTCIKPNMTVSLWIAATLAVGLILLPKMAPAQEEVTSAIRRYKEHEVSTGYYEETRSSPVASGHWWAYLESGGASSHTAPLRPRFVSVLGWLTHTGVSSFTSAGAARTATSRRPGTSTLSGPTLPAASATGESPSPVSTTITHP